jgi:hypothetical protein
MKLIKTRQTVSQDKEIPGLIKFGIAHTIKETTGQCSYTGPKITPEQWNEVLSFFKWTYDTTKSESQVRGFVNPREKKWGFWAFPQKANTGMTATELPEHPNTAEDRKQFKDEDGWIYFMTAHHHCSSGAFQSGTDEENERKQDGLHITIGKIDSPRHDLHARLYYNTMLFEADLSSFWDIGEEARKLVPEECEDKVARHQMCKSASVEFPQRWKDNFIDTRPKISEPITYGEASRIGMRFEYQSHGFGGSHFGDQPIDKMDIRSPWYLKHKSRLTTSAEDAVIDIVREALKKNFDLDDVILEWESFVACGMVELFHRTLAFSRASIDDVDKEMKNMADMEEAIDQAELLEGNGVVLEEKSKNKKKEQLPSPKDDNQDNEYGTGQHLWGM